MEQKLIKILIFVVLDNKKIIEFNGDKWHANPKTYKENDIPMRGINNKKS